MKPLRFVGIFYLTCLLGCSEQVEEQTALQITQQTEQEYSVVVLESNAKLLLENATIISVAADQPDAFVGYMVVDEKGIISDIAAGAAPESVVAEQEIDLDGKIIAPGFISAHSHIYMSPLRGLGHDVNLYGWFKAWDYYLKHTTADDAYWFTLHGSVDFLRNGITTAYDFTYPGYIEELTDDPSQPQGEGVLKEGPFEEMQFKAKLDSGMRFINSPWLSEVGSDDDIVDRFTQFYDWAKQYAGHPQYLAMAVSGQQQFTPTDRTAKLEARVMHAFNIMNQSHFLESPNAVAEQQEKFQWYDDAGVLGENMIFGHFIHTNDAILKRVGSLPLMAA